MSIVPSLQQPARERADATQGVPPRRRHADTSRSHFTESLANACNDRTPVAERAPMRADRDALADLSPDSEEYGIVKARLATQQRAQVQALMLSGAMKFAATRSDAPVTAALPEVLVSQPDQAEIPVVEAASTELADPMPAQAPHSDVAPASDAPTASIAATPDAAWALPIDTAVQSLPDVTTIIDVAPIGDPITDVPEAAEAVPSVPDLSVTNAATAAALQLIATLPITVTEPAPELEVTARDSASAPASVPETSDASMRLDGNVSSLPERSGSLLLEDHFDAPAVAIEIAPTMDRTSTASGVAARRETAPAAPSGAESTTAAARARSAESSTDAGLPQTDLAKLDPEFRDRLQRVIDRMRQEFGHAVTVVETVRSQARQNALFAQGRTAPGPVVTWTRNSKHGAGLAADLMVDGAWQNPLGYAHLAEVAKQEGLRTLGARDPGHVELPASGSVSGETLGNLLSDLQGDAGDTARQLRAEVHTERGAEARASMMARVADVAQVARVATVSSLAKVATVATVARPGGASTEAAPANEAISPLAVSGAPAVSVGSDAASVMRVATPVSAVNMADRITHLMDLQATQDAKPLNSVLLRMDNANGIDDQIRIDTRGTMVDARLGLGNAQQAAALTDRISELRDALERRGLTADGVRVHAAASTRATDSATFARPAAPVIELAALRAAAEGQAQGNTRDQSARDQAQREAFARDQSRNTPRPSSDDARHRSRREKPEERR